MYLFFNRTSHLQVSLRAKYVVPRVEVDLDTIDFGAVLVGQVVKQTLKLSNVQNVPVSWSYRTPGGVKNKSAVK